MASEDYKAPEPKVSSEQTPEEILIMPSRKDRTKKDWPQKKSALKIQARASSHLGDRSEMDADASLAQESVPLAEDVPEKLIASEPSIYEQLPRGHFIVSEPNHSATASEPEVNSEQTPDEILIVPSQKYWTKKDLSQRESAQKIQARVSSQEFFGHEERKAGRWKRRIAYGAIGAAIIALLYVAETSRETGVEKSVKATEPVKIEQTMVQPAKTEPPRTAIKSRALLELDIPATMPVDINEYVIKKGDTLWDISERFTGNPFNYPRIAGENKVTNPDLIFPGQRIRLNK